MINRNNRLLAFIFLIGLALFNASAALAQSTAFTYQGKLTDNGNPASGIYDLNFSLFDSPTVGSGTQQGTTLSLTSVAVTNGVFAVQLDFGVCESCFNGAARYLEISVRPAGGSTFTTLAPRQALTASPYAIKSLSAATADDLSVTCVSCVTSSQIASVNGSAVSGAIPVASVPAGSGNYIQNTTIQQANSNFNVSGNGVVGGNVGIGTTSPQFKLHVVGQDVRVEGNTTNVFPRFSWNFTGGAFNEKKWQAYAAPGSLNFSALGDGEFSETTWMQVNRSTLNIGSVIFPLFPNGVLGMGTVTPQARLHVVDTQANLNRPTTLRVETNFSGGTVASFGGAGEFQVDAPGVPAGRFVVKGNGFVGIGWTNPSGRLDVNGDIRFAFLGSGGSTTLCLNNVNQISSCSSSLRYKTNIANLYSGLNLLNRLRPVTFDWKATKEHDLGLIAEEVAEVEPLLIKHNQSGEIEGVKYDRLNVVLINAIKEQQLQIESLEKANLEMKARLAALERLLLAPHHHRVEIVNKTN
jgi:hypothetical protein